MPGWKGHLAGALVVGGLGVFAALAFGVYLKGEWEVLAALMAFCLLGALFPDVDTDSMGQRLYYLALAVVDAFLLYEQRWEWAAWLGFLALLPPMSPHRGWTHTWWAMLLVPAPIVLVPWLVLGHAFATFLPVYAAFVLGYFSHLLLDRQFR